jgi:nitrate reductase delta subunit
MKHFQVLSALLLYPEQPLLDAIPELDEALGDTAGLRTVLAPLFQYLASDELLELQQNYVETFDRGRATSLHMFEHVHGESRERGPAMVNLMEEYEKHGFMVDADELPDYIPLFLEFLSQTDEATAADLLGDAIHVIALVGNRLSERASPYACVFNALRMLTAVEPQPLVEPPVRDMDEMMEVFGPGADGVEPLLKPGPQTIQFHPRMPQSAGCAHH